MQRLMIEGLKFQALDDLPAALKASINVLFQEKEYFPSTVLASLHD